MTRSTFRIAALATMVALACSTGSTTVPLYPDVPDTGLDGQACDLPDGLCEACDDGDPCTVDRCECGVCSHSHRALQACESPPCSPEGSCLWVVSRGTLSEAERLLVLTLQGIVARHRPALWLDGAGWEGFATDLHDRHGMTFHPAPAGVAALLAAFRGSVDGYVLCDIGHESQTVAASLAGPWKAVAVDASLEPLAKAAGLPLLLDARGHDAAWCHERYAELFARDLLAIQFNDHRFREFLMDFAALRSAFVFHAGDDAFTTSIVTAAGGAPVVYGWGPDEHDLVESVSRGGGGVVGGDWSSNLSTLSLVREPVLKQPASDAALPPVEDGTHHVAFVISDGDNLHFLQNTFMTEPWFGSPHRGTFPITWEMTPTAARTTPSIMAWYYAHATTNDTFVAPPSGAAYSFPCYNPSPDGLVERTASAMALADQRVVTIMDDGDGMEAVDRYLDRPEISAALFKDYDGYNNSKGAVRFRNGKPAMAYRRMIWQTGREVDTPKGLAKVINAAPANPRRDSASYTLVAVHAWSEWKDSPVGSGAAGAVAWTVSLLQPHVKVVSAQEILGHLARDLEGVGPGCGNGACDPGETCGVCSQDCGPCIDVCTLSACGPGQTCETCPDDCGPCVTGPEVRFEAETDLAHTFGRAERGGWAAATDEPADGYLVSGPGTSALSGGWHTATFLLAIDDPAAAEAVVARLEVRDATTDRVLASREVTRHSFQAAFAWQAVPLIFQALARHEIEFRVWYTRKAWLAVDAVTVDD